MVPNNIHFLLWNLLTYFPMIISLVLYASISYHKKNKLKEDVLIFYKVLLTFIFLLYFCIYTFIILVIQDKTTFNDANKNFDNINSKIFIPFIIAIGLLDEFILYENYKSLRDPSYALRSYLSRNLWNLTYEFIIILVLAITIIIEIIFPKEIDENNRGIFIPQIDYYFWFYLIIFFFLAFSLFFYFYKREIIETCIVKGKAKANAKNKIEFYQSLIYLILSLYISLISGIELYLKYLNQDNPNLFYYFRLVFNYLFFVVLSIDLLLMMYSVYLSDFFFYTLGNKRIGRLYFIFGKKYHKKPVLDYSGMSNSSKESSVVFLHDQLKFMMDEYSLNTFDNMINISLASLYKIFSTMKKPIEKSNDVTLNLKLNIADENMVNSLSESDKTKTLIEKDIENINNNNNKDRSNNEDIKVYEFEKFELTDDHLFKQISLNQIKDSSDSNKAEMEEEYNLSVSVKSFFDQKFIDVFKSKNKLNHQDLLDSLTSNLNPNLNGWYSLINKNIKEEYFRKQNKLVLNTYNGLYNLEICDEDSIFTDDNKACSFAKKYLKYMKNHNLSFLPIIVGIFKVKINNFKELTILLSKNMIIEDTPKEYFNYWQLSRFTKKRTFEMVTSSKDRTSNLIKDENFFNDRMVLTMNEYQNFRNILEDDIHFLRQIKSKNFELLVNYYELGANLNVTNSSQNEDVPFQRISVENLIGGFRLSVISKTNRSQFAKDQILSKQNASFRNVSNKENESQSLLEDINVIIFKNKVGFEASYNNFRSILFFEFQNPFDNYSKCCYEGYYNKFLSKFLSYFEAAKPFELN